jgi:molybdenum cofactor biosynthesis enzyme
MGIFAPIIKHQRVKKSVDVREKEIQDRRDAHQALLEMEQEFLELHMLEEITKIDMVFAAQVADQEKSLKKITAINKRIDVLKKQIPLKQKEVLGVTYKVVVAWDNPRGTPITYKQ